MENLENINQTEEIEDVEQTEENKNNKNKNNKNKTMDFKMRMKRGDFGSGKNLERIKEIYKDVL